MTPQVQDFISRSLEDTDKHIEVVDEHYVTAKKKGKIQIRMCDDNRDLFIVTFHKIIWSPDICDRVFQIITLMSSGYTCLFNKGFCMVYFGD